MRTSIADVDFGGAYLVDSMFEESTITNCTFGVANMSRRKTEGKPFGRMANSRFIRCDFRNTTITGMQMEGVVFERCRFHGARGAPAPGFDVTLIEPDFASTGDA